MDVKVILRQVFIITIKMFERRGILRTYARMIKHPMFPHRDKRGKIAPSDHNQRDRETDCVNLALPPCPPKVGYIVLLQYWTSR